MPSGSAPITDERKIRFNNYDFFGYFLPGLVLSTALIYLSVVKIYGTFEWFVQNIIEGKTQTFFAFIALLVFFSYVLGHIAASISAIFFDRLYLKKIKGYPFQKLIFNHTLYDGESAYFHRLLLLIIFLFPLLYISRHTIHVTGTEMAYWVALFTIASTIIHGIARKSEKIELLSFWLFRILSAPVWAMENFSRASMDLDRPLSDDARDKFIKGYNEIFGYHPSVEKSSDVFWLTYWFINSRSEASRGPIQNWLLLYGFLRNLSMCFLLSSLVFGISDEGATPYNIVQCIALSMLITSVLLFIRYYYIYYNYYSKSIARLLILETTTIYRADKN